MKYSKLLIVAIIIVVLVNVYCICEKNTRVIISLVRQTARWSTAAMQDTNAYIKNLHANYAQGYVMALRDNFSEAEIYRASGINIRVLSDKVSKIQNSALVALSKLCPEGRPKDQFLAFIAKQAS